MDATTLFSEIKKKQSFLCIGLDVDLDKIPAHLLASDDPVFEFNKAVVDATHHLAVAYKPNLAFYEALGTDGLNSLQKTTHYIKEHYPELFLIADAKRGDIGNTAKMYAKAMFEHYAFDAVTLSPYMGHDSISPFLEYPGKYVIILGVTSNAGADDFQFIETREGTPLFMEIIRKATQWGTTDQLMFVVGATRPEILAQVRKVAPNHFLLIPGVGAQGGDLQSVAKNGLTDGCGLLVNSSRAIIYAGNDEKFAQAAQEVAEELQQQMAKILAEK
ncbi:MAG: orotidine-5'-phosphate decarboxylase [Salinivirgaceae bacterium]|jgi:orotidine-5'-phosphate decarboxylase|nr:orotidine-5'-phosphate decarboxylase [Salinivirgaceae bacterium]